ncbi:hypothetical protein DMY87_12995 [Rhizobium wuzhouense]|uniref:Uncharacterized protein n=1 Tax=Rhizobium wuzhouense TaxID=1986026 RepID=A0ABX5NQU6_9HYPH|nr:hypothetical protein DMY87_12995 [Rhizobium wuzhouense]
MVGLHFGACSAALAIGFLLPTAYCLLPTAYCLLPTAFHVSRSTWAALTAAEARFSTPSFE